MEKGPESSFKTHFKPSDWRKLQADNQQSKDDMAQDWQKVAKDKADQVLSLIPQEWRISNIPSAEEQRDVTGAYIHQFLDKKEIEITETDAVGVVEKTTSGQWSAVEVAKAFCHRAAIAHQLVNCLHEIFFDQAIAEAEKADQYFKENKKPIGVLHGLPVSLKDQFHVKGVDTHMGYVGWIGNFQGKTGTGKERNYESMIVKELRKMGATLYCKTSVPHTLMCGETVNNIVGYTWNPKNRNLSSGGSSGGEGALIGLRGSCAGFGTDIGGSIRIPAAFNGLYGLRPSVGRLPYEGMANSFDGQGSLLSVVGPLATTADSLKFLTQALLSTSPWLHDPLTHEIPWRPTAELAVSDPHTRTESPLSFAVLTHDGSCAVHPPVARALKMVVDTLRSRGHTVIDWKPTPSHTYLGELAGKIYSFDGGADSKYHFGLSGEQPAPQLISPDNPEYSASEIMAVNIAKREAQKDYLDYWNSTAEMTGTGRPVDAVISPLAPFAAARPEKYTYLTYSSYVNLLDYTSVVVPVTQVDKSVDKKDEGFKALDEVDQATQDTCEYCHCCSEKLLRLTLVADDPEIYDGAHVSVQLVGRRLQEEKMIALAKYVGDALHGKAHTM
jgi:amidase